MADTAPILRISDLVIRYPKRGILAPRPKPAVKGVSFDVQRGQTLALVGESGSGKSSILRAILRLTPVESGSIELEGRDWLALPQKDMRAARARIGIVAQNPFLSLSPRLSVAQILAEPMQAAGGASKTEIAERTTSLLATCGLPASYMQRRAHDLSGGQAQRVAIARALTLHPKLMILDEPTSALDISVQAQILNLLDDLKAQLGLSILIVTHDLGVARHLADRLVVMRAGSVVEQGPTEAIIAAPKDPYTKELIEA